MPAQMIGFIAGAARMSYNMTKRIEPTMGDYAAVLERDLAVDPPVGDIDNCVCFDDDTGKETVKQRNKNEEE